MSGVTNKSQPSLRVRPVDPQHPELFFLPGQCFIPRKAKKSKCFPFNLSKSKKSNCFLSGFRVQQTWQSQFCQKNVANLAGASVARKNKQIKQMLVLLEKMKQIKQILLLRQMHFLWAEYTLIQRKLKERKPPCFHLNNLLKPLQQKRTRESLQPVAR